MLNVQLSKPDDSRGEWVNLPAPYAKTKSVFDALADEEHPALLITAAESSVSYLHSHLVGKYADREQSVRELDFLARRIEGLTEQEQDVFSAMLEIEQPRSLMELVNLSCNMDKFDFFPKIISEKELGEYLLNRDDSSIPEQLVPYIDYELVGSQYVNHHAGRFTDDGYVVRTGEALKPVYDGKHLPDPAYDANGLFLLRLYSSHYADSHPNTYSLSLPASEEKLALARENLGVGNLDECSLIDLRCSIGALENHLPCSYGIEELNGFAALLKDKVLDGTEETVEKLCAALTAEMPDNIRDASWVAKNLRFYTLLPEDIETPLDYAHHVLQEADIFIDDEIQDFVDYEGFGKYRMLRDGVVQTVHGMVLREGDDIRQIPEELTTLKLFSPLYPQLYERNEWGDLESEPVTMGADELCGYQDEIHAAIEQENLREEGDRGLAVYLRNELLKRKVFSMNPTVEEWNGRLWGVLEVQSYGPLSDAELKAVKDEWSGQESDGWGEGFEQREIKIDTGELCVSFWSSDDSFFIQTEQELKSEPEQRFGMTMGGM
ncbi:antirestriction protein ArdA [Dysosmobacter welbionis]|uniref:antirestriction protein ArdA n=1 Tax=Dysosmobacter welbionis TaxID=2093857 RepID=UPI0032BF40B1